MLIKKGSELKYLENYREGKIKVGLGIGNDLDKYIVCTKKAVAANYERPNSNVCWGTF